MEKVALGSTGLEVSRLGAGLAEVGDAYATGAEGVRRARRVLEAALDAGINSLYTAACYGTSEELIGLAVAGRRHQFVLATKCGHTLDDEDGEPFTAQTVARSVDRSLRRMRTDYLDLVQLHSCDMETLRRGEAISALQRARDAGKTRFIGYSGDNDEARWAVESGLFDTPQTSSSIVDQHARTKGVLAAAAARGMGVIAKRPLANGVWGAGRSPSGYADEYFRRAQEMARLGPIADASAGPVAVALGFVLAHPAVDTAIVGTRSAAHMRDNAALAARGLDLAPAVLEEFRRRFDRLGDDWLQRT